VIEASDVKVRVFRMLCTDMFPNQAGAAGATKAALAKMRSLEEKNCGSPFVNRSEPGSTKTPIPAGAPEDFWHVRQ
jgi:hypothetical protein